MFDLVLNGHIRVGKLDFPIQLELFSSSPTKPLIGGYILLAGSTDGSNSSPLGHLKCTVCVLVLLFLVIFLFLIPHFKKISYFPTDPLFKYLEDTYISTIFP